MYNPPKCSGTGALPILERQLSATLSSEVLCWTRARTSSVLLILQLSNNSNYHRQRASILDPYVPTIEESTTFQFIVNPSTGVQDSHQTDPTATSPQSTATPRRITITLMDLGGHPLYYALWPSAIAAADAFMLVYDVGDRQSLQSLWKYYRLIVETKSTTLSMARPDEIPMLLVGSMVDTVTSNKMLSTPTTTTTTTTTTRTTTSASIESTPHAIPRTGGYCGHTTSTPLSTAKRPRQISSQMGQMFADILHIPHDETTSKAPQSITYCFRKLISEAQNKAAGMMLAAQTMNADTVAGLGLLFPTQS
ncbi:hypothetical protein BASA62_009311 [Batrachochytrium salamandrivorans]|nr:hypothetical protein BASA62_009311 [Batrachochytrium salamandrivorans]